MELPGQGYGNIMPRKNSRVEGALYVVSETEMELLKKADGWPDQYEVKEVTVTCNGRMVQALTLVACADQLGEGLKPLRSYLDHILAGNDLMNAEYYQRLLDTPTLD